MKKTLSVILAIIMLFSLVGCKWFKKSEEQQAKTDDPVTTAAPADTAAPDATDEPYSGDEGDPAKANEEFEALDLDIFKVCVTSGSDSYNQYIVSDPGKFGIDPSTVEKGWGELSYESHKETMDYARDVLSKLRAINRSGLSDENRHAYDMLVRVFETQLKYEDFYYYDEPLTPMNGAHSMLPLTMICISIRNLDDIETYLYLIEDMERYIGQIAQFEDEKAKQGLFMSEVALDQVIESCRSFAAKGEDSFLISYFEDVLKKGKELGLSESECQELRSRNKDLVINHVLPAFTHLADVLESHRGDCSPFTGACNRSEKAKEYFELSARDEGATMDSMDRVLELLIKMGEGTYSSLTWAVIYGGEEVMNKYGTETSFGSVENNLDWLKKFIAQYYPAMPDYKLNYINVPEDIAEDFSPAAYLTPAFDDYYDNLMLLNPTSEGSDDLFTIAHETIPGHMYQFLNARNNKSLSLSQQILEPTGYAEAWTVFTEGFIATKCFDLGINYCTMMNCESTFCNIFLPSYISIQVNSYGWTMDEVEEYLTTYGIADAADIFYEYAVTMPVYAMSYAIGYSYLYEIYHSVEPDTPEAHKAFFEKYLSYGPNYMDMMLDYMCD